MTVPRSPETPRKECLPEKLRSLLAGRCAAVLGVGNTLRGDDGFGPAVIERLTAYGGTDVPGSWFLVPGPTAEGPTTDSPQPGTRNQPLNDARGREPVERELGTRNRPVFLNAGSAPENFAGRLRRERPEVLLVLDAADFAGVPGELRLLSPGELAGGGLSTHAGSLAMLFDYLRAECGTEAAVLAAQAGSLKLGEGLSAPVAEAVERAAGMLRAILPGLSHA